MDTYELVIVNVEFSQTAPALYKGRNTAIIQITARDHIRD